VESFGRSFGGFYATHLPEVHTSSRTSQLVPLFTCYIIMSGSSEAAAAASSLPIIKVHVMLPGGSSIENDTYVSIKYSKGTTAEEVISHVSKKKVQLHPASPHSLTFLQQLPALRFELVYLPSGDYTPSCVKSESIVLSGPAIISDIVSKVLRIDASSNPFRRSRPCFRSRCRVEGFGGFARRMKTPWLDWYTHSIVLSSACCHVSISSVLTLFCVGSP